MIVRQAALDEIAAGRITLQFRRWERPTVKAGGTLLTSHGQLAIDAVEPVRAEEISDADARAAGFEDARALRAALERGRPDGTVYRVALHVAGPDPRLTLREQLPDAEELDAIRRRLARWDGASPVGPWTRATLEAIGAHPQMRAAALAERTGFAKDRFKTNVRKLKSLGLTESLGIGYRLSPRGRAVLGALED